MRTLPTIKNKRLVSNNTAFLRPSATQSGFSLIEVLISSLILSGSMLGVLSMQFVGMKGTHQSVMKQQAIGIVQNAMERMAANRSAVLDGLYEFKSADVDCTTKRPTCSASSCSKEKIALLDTLILVCGNKAIEGVLAGSRTGGLKIENNDDIVSLPSGSLDIACRGGCALGDVTVTVGWAQRAFKEEAAKNGSISLNLRVAAP